jgi:hypothetical protein
LRIYRSHYWVLSFATDYLILFILLRFVLFTKQDIMSLFNHSLATAAAASTREFGSDGAAGTAVEEPAGEHGEREEERRGAQGDAGEDRRAGAFSWFVARFFAIFVKGPINSGQSTKITAIVSSPVDQATGGREVGNLQ